MGFPPVAVPAYAVFLMAIIEVHSISALKGICKGHPPELGSFLDVIEPFGQFLCGLKVDYVTG